MKRHCSPFHPLEQNSWMFLHESAVSGGISLWLSSSDSGISAYMPSAFTFTHFSLPTFTVTARSKEFAPCPVLQDSDPHFGQSALLNYSPSYSPPPTPTSDGVKSTQRNGFSFNPAVALGSRVTAWGVLCSLPGSSPHEQQQDTWFQRCPSLTIFHSAYAGVLSSKYKLKAGAVPVYHFAEQGGGGACG